MARYRVNQANSLFPGERGTTFEAVEGPMLTAGVVSGALSRIDSSEASKKRGRPVGSKNKGSEELAIDSEESVDADGESKDS